MCKNRQESHRMLASASASFLWITILLFIICGASDEAQTEETVYSLFLQNYWQLSIDKEGAMSYKNLSKGLKQYNKFMLDPVVVHFAANAKGTAVDPAKLVQLTDYAHRELVKGLSKRYQVVGSPGPGVLRIRSAITDIKKALSAHDIKPGEESFGVGLGGASMEAEGLDSQTGERVIAVVDSRQGEKISTAERFDEFGHAKEVIRYWIMRFVRRLDKAHGYIK